MPDEVVHGPREGEVLRNAKAGRVAVVKCAFPPPDPHTHGGETDSFSVLEGALDFCVGGFERALRAQSD